MPNYYDNWKKQRFTCRNCGWQGTGADCPQGESFRELFEINCPACGEHVAVVSYPTIEEAKHNWDKLSEGDRLLVSVVEQKQQDFDARRLKWPRQLPDIEEESFSLVWDEEDHPSSSDTVIKLGRQIIWREPAIYEGYERFGEVAKILRRRYGPKLTDLIPTKRSLFCLYGDYLSAPRRVLESRARLGSLGVPEWVVI